MSSDVWEERATEVGDAGMMSAILTEVMMSSFKRMCGTTTTKGMGVRVEGEMKKDGTSSQPVLTDIHFLPTMR